MQEHYEILLGLITGLGLAAACGFRVFVPLLVASIAIRAGAVEVAPGFAWIGSTPATIGFGFATLLEIGGYYLPGVDHFLDALATPAAVVAGTLVTAAFLTDVDPWLRWSLAAVAGGGIAGAVQAGTVLVRGASGITTMGLANPVVATAELAGSSAAAVMTLIAPFLVVAAVVVALALAVRWWRRRREARADLVVLAR